MAASPLTRVRAEVVRLIARGVCGRGTAEDRARLGELLPWSAPSRTDYAVTELMLLAGASLVHTHYFTLLFNKECPVTFETLKEEETMLKLMVGAGMFEHRNWKEGIMTQSLQSFHGSCPPIHVAVHVGHAQCVEVVAENGMDVNHKFCGSTPLDIAFWNGDVPVIKALLRKGAEPSREQRAQLRDLQVELPDSDSEGPDSLQKQCRRVLRNSLLKARPDSNIIYGVQRMWASMDFRLGGPRLFTDCLSLDVSLSQEAKEVLVDLIKPRPDLSKLRRLISKSTQLKTTARAPEMLQERKNFWKNDSR